MKISRSF